MQTPHTEEQNREFKIQFRKRRVRQIILTVPLIVGFFGIEWLRNRNNPISTGNLPLRVIVTAFLVLAGGALAFSFKNWRCPACNSYLGRSISPRYCPKCGAELR